MDVKYDLNVTPLSAPILIYRTRSQLSKYHRGSQIKKKKRDQKNSAALDLFGKFNRLSVSDVMSLPGLRNVRSLVLPGVHTDFGVDPGEVSMTGVF